MQKLVTVNEMRDIEREADAHGLSYAMMMQNAGNGMADMIGGQFMQGSIFGLVGSGNNGGDALVALTNLAEKGWISAAYLVRPRELEDPLIKRLEKAGGRVISVEEDEDSHILIKCLNEASVLIDGILGTGIKLPLKPGLADILNTIGENQPLPTVVAVDCPSGVDCDTGEAAEEVIPADITMCMAAVKTGLLKFPAFDKVGEIRVVDIGLADNLESWANISRQMVKFDDVRDALPKRPRTAHKGTFGTALIITGSINYTGAAILAGKAAYRIGTGLVNMGIPGLLHTALSGHLPEATWLLLPHDVGVIAESAYDVVINNLDRVTAILLGPGWGTEETTEHFLQKMIITGTPKNEKGPIGFISSMSKNHGISFTEMPPLIIDADGLKLLVRIPDWHKAILKQAVLTPHPGEMAVMTGLSTAVIQNDRIGTAEKYAKQWGHVVVLKGANTVVASPDGRVGVIPVASPALARAGTGDVLSGLIVGLRAQGMSAYEAAMAASWIHAQAGVLAAENYGNTASVLAGDVLAAVPEILRTL